MRLTLLKAAEYPSDCDRGVHQFTYSLYPHSGNLDSGDTVHQGYQLNFPLHGEVFSARSGKLPCIFSLLRVVCFDDSVILETVKMSGARDSVIVRMYENSNRSTDFRLICGFPVDEAWECDLLENREVQLYVEDGAVFLHAAPYEIITVELVF